MSTTELLVRGLELLGEYKDRSDIIHALTTDHNEDLSAIALSITMIAMVLPGESSVRTAKSFVEVAFYLGYLAGKEEGNLKLWEDQL